MLFKHKTITKTIHIEGLHCDGCAKRVATILSTFKEIKEANVSYADKRATIVCKKEIDNKKLEDAINDLGFIVTNIE